MHDAAIRIARRYNLQLFDSLVVACAINSGSSVLWSEDMGDGMTIDRLTISNPFGRP
jgi:predicted nucleic acid-binding protein